MRDVTMSKLKVFLLLCVGGCGGTAVTADSGSDATVDSAADAPRDTDLIIPQDRPDPADADTAKPIVDGGSDCGLPVDAGSHVTCCNGKMCAGNCVEIGPEIAACECFGTDGGCAGDTVCCPYFPKGCTAPLFCGPSH